MIFISVYTIVCALSFVNSVAADVFRCQNCKRGTENLNSSLVNSLGNNNFIQKYNRITTHTNLNENRKKNHPDDSKKTELYILRNKHFSFWNSGFGSVVGRNYSKAENIKTANKMVKVAKLPINVTKNGTENTFFNLKTIVTFDVQKNEIKIEIVSNNSERFKTIKKVLIIKVNILNKVAKAKFQFILKKRAFLPKKSIQGFDEAQYSLQNCAKGSIQIKGNYDLKPVQTTKDESLNWMELLKNSSNLKENSGKFKRTPTSDDSIDTNTQLKKLSSSKDIFNIKLQQNNLSLSEYDYKFKTNHPSVKRLKRSKRPVNFNHRNIKLNHKKNNGFKKRTFKSDLHKPKYNFVYLNSNQTKLTPKNEIMKTMPNSEFKESNSLQNFYNTGSEQNSNKEFLKYQKRFLKPNFSTRNHYVGKNFKRQNLNLKHLLNTEATTGIYDVNDLRVRLLKNQYLNDLNNFNLNHKFNDFKNISLKRAATTDNSLNLELRNEILNCKAFASLEDLFKSLPKNISNAILSNITEKKSFPNSMEKNEIEINKPLIPEVTTSAALVAVDSINRFSSTSEITPDEEDETCTGNTEDYSEPTEVDFEQTTESNLKTSTDATSAKTVHKSMTEDCLLPASILKNDFKLNITINAKVHGINNNCNGSFNVSHNPHDEDRGRRQIYASSLEKLQNRKCAQIPTQNSL